MNYWNLFKIHILKGVKYEMQLTREEYLQILDGFDFIDEVFCTVENDAKLIKKLFNSLDKSDQVLVSEKTSSFLKIHDNI